MRIVEELTGKAYGHLTVLSRAESRKGRSCWLCRCECGKEKVVSAHDLKSGRVKSCGCMQYEHGHNRVDLSGQRFGKLTALYPTEKRDGRGSVIWHCKCDCGHTIELSQAELVYGNRKSCGCMKTENQKKLPARLHRIDGTCLEILERRKHRCDNRSGFRGVYRTDKGRYRVDIGFKGRRFYLGTYDSYDEAVTVRTDAEQRIHDGFVKEYREWHDNGEKTKFIFDVEKSPEGDLVIKRE